MLVQIERDAVVRLRPPVRRRRVFEHARWRVGATIVTHRGPCGLVVGEDAPLGDPSVTNTREPSASHLDAPAVRCVRRQRGAEERDAVAVVERVGDLDPAIREERKVPAPAFAHHLQADDLGAERVDEPVALGHEPDDTVDVVRVDAVHERADRIERCSHRPTIARWRDRLQTAS